MEAAPRIELGIKVLQTSALPLGYAAIWSGKRDSNPRPQPWQGCALPLSYFRMRICNNNIISLLGDLSSLFFLINDFGEVMLRRHEPYFITPSASCQ